jgi:hypothetical protein
MLLSARETSPTRGECLSPSEWQTALNFNIGDDLGLVEPRKPSLDRGKTSKTGATALSVVSVKLNWRSTSFIAIIIADHFDRI